MIVWRGKGLVVLLAAIVFWLMQMTVDAMNRPGAYANSMWAPILAGLIAAVPLWFLGRKFNSDEPRVLVDQKTGKKIVLKESHDFFFIPVEYWAFITLAVGIFIGLSNAPVKPAERTASESAVSAPAETPAPAIEPVATASVPAAAPPPVQATMVTPRATPPPASDPAKPIHRSERAAIDFPTLEQVYVDQQTRVFYSADCTTRPATATRMAKSVALRSGFAAASCPR